LLFVGLSLIAFAALDTHVLFEVLFELVTLLSQFEVAAFRVVVLLLQLVALELDSHQTGGKLLVLGRLGKQIVGDRALVDLKASALVAKEGELLLLGYGGWVCGGLLLDCTQIRLQFLVFGLNFQQLLREIIGTLLHLQLESLLLLLSGLLLLL